MSQNNLYKGFEVELFTGSLNSHIGVSAEIEKKFRNFVKEPDNRNVEYITTPEKDYGSLYEKLITPRKKLRQWLNTKNLTITLIVSPNGIPGLKVDKNDNKTSDRGDTSLFKISLKTHPIADVEIPIETDFDGIMLSQNNLIFTPSNWSIPQTITLTGIDNNSIEISQMYNVNIGKIISDDSDYSKIDINDLKFEHKILKKPIIREITPIGPLINFNSPNYTFSSTKRGIISLGGSCFSDNKTAFVNTTPLPFYH